MRVAAPRGHPMVLLTRTLFRTGERRSIGSVEKIRHRNHGQKYLEGHPKCEVSLGNVGVH